LRISEKIIDDFFAVLKYLKISNTIGNRKYVEKTYEDAKDILREYYKVN
jgi:hypothetical protein